MGRSLTVMCVMLAATPSLANVGVKTCQGGTCENDMSVLLQANSLNANAKVAHAQRTSLVASEAKQAPKDSGSNFPTTATGGNPWNDYSQMGAQAWGPTQITVTHGTRVDSLKFKYSSGSDTTHGGSGGGADPVFLIGDGEFITKVKIVGTQRLSGIQFFLNNGRVSKATTGDSDGNIGGGSDPNPGTTWVYASPDNGKTCALTYCNTYPDLKNAFCGGAVCSSDAHSQSCLNHFETYGRNEHRQPDPEKCAAESGYAIYSFKGQSGNGMDAIGFYYGLSPQAAACKNLPIQTVTGAWEYKASANGGVELEVTKGTTHETASENSKEWGTEVGGSVSMGYKIPLVGGGEASVESKYSSSQSQSYEESFESSEEQTTTLTFERGGVLWSWVFTTVDPCGTSKTMQDYAMTRNMYETPCCLPGWALDTYTQFGPCAGGSPNLCDDGQQSSPTYGVKEEDSSVKDLNVKWAGRGL